MKLKFDNSDKVQVTVIVDGMIHGPLEPYEISELDLKRAQIIEFKFNYVEGDDLTESELVQLEKEIDKTVDQVNRTRRGWTGMMVEAVDPETGAVAQTFMSQLEAARQTKLSNSSISRAIQSNKLCGGYIWRNSGYTSTRTNGRLSRCAVIQLDRKTRKVINEFQTQRDAERATGINASNISKATRGILPHAGGYIWHRV